MTVTTFRETTTAPSEAATVAIDAMRRFLETRDIEISFCDECEVLDQMTDLLAQLAINTTND